MPSVSLILPIYNEVKLLRGAVEQCADALGGSFSDYEIIIVDDGSTDGSREILTDLSAKNSKVKAVFNHVNLNVGVSVQRGMFVAEKDFVVHNGIDLPLAPDGIARLVREMEGYDVLVLERDSYPGYTPWRWVCSKVNRLLIRFLFRQSIRDLNFTQMYRRAALPRIRPVAKSPAFTTPEMILRAIDGGLRVKTIEWPYQKRQQGKGAFGKPHDILWNLYDMVRYFLFLRNRCQSVENRKSQKCEPASSHSS